MKSIVRIALANLEVPATPDQSVRLASEAIAEAGAVRAQVICFPECYVPGYRASGKHVPPSDAKFLERAWAESAAAAANAGVAVILGTERVVDGHTLASALVIDGSGALVGFQDKVQID